MNNTEEKKSNTQEKFDKHIEDFVGRLAAMRNSDLINLYGEISRSFENHLRFNCHSEIMFYNHDELSALREEILKRMTSPNKVKLPIL